MNDFVLEAPSDFRAVNSNSSEAPKRLCALNNKSCTGSACPYTNQHLLGDVCMYVYLDLCKISGVCSPQGCDGGYGFLQSKWTEDVGLVPESCAPFSEGGGSCQIAKGCQGGCVNMFLRVGLALRVIALCFLHVRTCPV